MLAEKSWNFKQALSYLPPCRCLEMQEDILPAGAIRAEEETCRKELQHKTHTVFFVYFLVYDYI